MIANAQRRRSHQSIQAATCHHTTDELFVSLLPAIRRYARAAWQFLNLEAREEAVQATVAHAFVAFAKLAQEGRAELAYPTPLARYAVARVRDGRCVGNRSNSRDVTSTRCRQCRVVPFGSPQYSNSPNERWREVLIEDRRAGPADIASMRIDFASWLESLSRGDRRTAQILASGEDTKTAAQRLGVSPGRVSQLRAKLRQAWMRFQNEIEHVKPSRNRLRRKQA